MALKVQGSNIIKVVFLTEYEVNYADARLAVSGSIFELGDWIPGASLPAIEFPRGCGKWISAFIMTPQKQFSWKWVVISKDRSRTIRWKEIENREQTIGNESVILHAPWNEPALPQKYENIHIPEDSDALGKYARPAIENWDEDKFTEEKANLGDYNYKLIQGLAMNKPALPQRYKSIHKPVGSGALGKYARPAIENSDEDKFTEEKANLGDYNYKLIQGLAMEIIEQETEILLALIDMIKSGDEMGIKRQLFKKTLSKSKTR